ncbi:hypothetical protein BT96DRAFT_932521 [Gymnopus androsaceus JB14]|uniref:Uncharacterized protein n=1 Tax=Gymnopus androsaceus JB14 TaxID=1447944 RepID=A0A6A4IJK5_9AGAR|nr:hypothetical protein BT96DRAFT_932521 [Gymnopus androsaceus JB14]
MWSLARKVVLATLFLTSPLFLGTVADDIPVAPAPWTLNVTNGWIFVLPPLLSSIFLPAGFADPPEAEVEASTGIMTTTDIGLMMIVRYESSPVDDEMIYIPGKWAYDDGLEGFRITRIYVSRENWNIPKHIGIFDFQEDGLGGTSVSLTSPDGDGTPFFSVNILPTTLPIPIEVNSTLTGGFLNFLQPPLPAETLPVEVGTTTWKQFLLSAQTTTLQANVISGALPGGKIGDGVGYPDIQPLVPIGVQLTGILDFPVPGVFDSV